MIDPELKASLEIELDLLAIESLTTGRRLLAAAGLSAAQAQQYEPRLKAAIEQLKRESWVKFNKRFG